MKTSKFYPKTVLTTFAVIFLSLNHLLNAQNVGIGAASFSPNPSAMLDVTSTTKGILIPRMSSTDRTNITTPAQGLLVYENTTNQFYYYTGSAWKPVLSNSTGWQVTGNSGTSASTNFIGTTDAIDFVLRANNTERMRINASTGFVGIGTNSPSQMLSIWQGMNVDQENANNGNLNNALRFGSGNGVGIASRRLAGANQYGLDFYTNSLNRMCIDYANGNVGIGTTGPSAKLEVINSSTSRGAFIHNNSASNTANALRVEQDGSGYGIYCGVTGTATTGIYCTQGGVSPNLGTIGSTSGGWSISLGNGKGLSTGGRDIGVEGCAKEDNNTGTDQLGGAFYVQGFSSGTSAFACIGSVVDNVAYKIVGTGIVSTVVHDLQGNPVVMAAPEAPEALFQDFGTGQLINGKVHISLDPILSKNITVDENHPVKIFIQLNDECNGVFVNNKDGKGFDVTELGNGTSNAGFSWMLTATRKNETRGGVTSDYENFRFKRTNNPGFTNHESIVTGHEMIKK